MSIENFVNKIEKELNIKYRKYQRETIISAIKAVEENDYRNIIIEAQTGFGKSITNAIIAKYFIDKYHYKAYYTTPQINLLEQLYNDSRIKSLGLRVIKGKEHYECPISVDITGKKLKCNVAPCVTKKKFVCDIKNMCPYYADRETAILSDICALSFAFLMRTADNELWGNRDILIVDEADDIESWAADFATVELHTNKNIQDKDELIDFAKKKIKTLNREIAFIENMDEISVKMLKELSKLKETKDKLEMFINNPKEYTFSKVGNKLTIRPVDVGKILNRTIWCRGSEIVIVSSATIISKDMFKKYSGLTGNTLFIRVPPIIPQKNRPIFYVPAGKMTKECREDTYDKLIDIINVIAKKHENEKGLIHAHSYEIAEVIKRRLETNHIVITHNSNDRNEKLKEFIDEDKPAVFVSVGFERGIDLKYDLCRWQVITKIPFPDINDIRVKEIWLKRHDWKWARYQAIKKLIQACGRIVRAVDDYGVTYILDSSFENLYRYKKEIPKYFNVSRLILSNRKLL